MLLCSSQFIFLYSLVNNDGVVLSFVAVLFKLLLNSILWSGFLFSLGWNFLFSWLLSVTGFLSENIHFVVMGSALKTFQVDQSH